MLQFSNYAIWGQNYFNISDYLSQVSTCMNTINNYGILKMWRESVTNIYHQQRVTVIDILFLKHV